MMPYVALHWPWGLLGLRAAPKEDSGTSSVELVLGSPLLLPREMLHMPEVPCVHRPPPSTRPALYVEAANTPLPHLVGAENVLAGGQQRPRKPAPSW